MNRDPVAVGLEAAKEWADKNLLKQRESE